MNKKKKIREEEIKKAFCINFLNVFSLLLFYDSTTTYTAVKLFLVTCEIISFKTFFSHSILFAKNKRHRKRFRTIFKFFQFLLYSLFLLLHLHTLNTTACSAVLIFSVELSHYVCFAFHSYLYNN